MGLRLYNGRRLKMKGMIPVKGYQEQEPSHENVDFRNILKDISLLTKVGAGFFVAGKLFGILAIPAVFIPSLNIFVIPLIICWGSFIFATIVICSYDHFVISKRKAETSLNKAAEIQTWLAEHPGLREEILADLLAKEQEIPTGEKKIVELSKYR